MTRTARWCSVHCWPAAQPSTKCSKLTVKCTTFCTRAKSRAKPWTSTGTPCVSTASSLPLHLTWWLSVQMCSPAKTPNSTIAMALRVATKHQSLSTTIRPPWELVPTHPFNFTRPAIMEQAASATTISTTRPQTMAAAVQVVSITRPVRLHRPTTTTLRLPSRITRVATIRHLRTGRSKRTQTRRMTLSTRTSRSGILSPTKPPPNLL